MFRVKGSMKTFYKHFISENPSKSPSIYHAFGIGIFGCFHLRYILTHFGTVLSAEDMCSYYLWNTIFIIKSERLFHLLTVFQVLCAKLLVCHY